VGHISGGHFNPAVTLGLWAAGRCANRHVLPYLIAQVVDAILAAGVLWMIASGKPDWVAGGFASNGYGDLSPGKYGLAAGCMTEILATFFFRFIIIGIQGGGDRFRWHPHWSRTYLHLITIPVTNTSVNPARSTGPALFAGSAHVGQLWLFWMTPLPAPSLSAF
jgi:aquaporin Z